MEITPTRPVSNFTQLLLNEMVISPNEVAEVWMVRMFGCVMFGTSILGILVNAKVFYGFCSLKMTSFYLMCASKTVSNMCIISGYLFYNGPISIMNNFTSVTFTNKIVNQMVIYGVYLMGPVTQYLISVNRLLVFYFVKQSTTQNNQKITLVVLSAFWVIALCVIAVGSGENCIVIFIPDILDWFSGGCDDVLADVVITFVILCAALSNFCNFLVAVKLMASILKQKGRLDSESTARRKRQSRKLFVQNCIQDWIFVIDSLNSAYIHKLVANVAFQFIFSVYSNLFTYVLDGCIMLFFNCETKKKRTLAVLTVKNAGSGGGTGGGGGVRSSQI